MNNFVRFNRFTSLNPNIAQHGLTVEEFKSSQGAPEGDPIHSPMAAPSVSDTRLALVRRGSDNLRLNTPQGPEANPFEGPKRTLVLSRNAVTKLQGRVVGELNQVVRSASITNDEVRTRMLDSLARVNGLTSFVGHLNSMSESVMAHSLSASKG